MLLHPLPTAAVDEPSRPEASRSDLARCREATYRLVSQAFLYPDAERLQGVLENATQVREEGALPVQLASYTVWCHLLQSLIALGGCPATDLEDRYVSLFVINSRSVPCPPYESACLEGKGPQAGGELLAEVEREYAAAGLALPPALGELPDHIAIELEFLALLCEREAVGWERRSPRRSLIALRQQKAFLDRHLGAWLPAFARRLAAADRIGTYAAIGKQANAFVRYDRDLLAALLEAKPREISVS